RRRAPRAGLRHHRRPGRLSGESLPMSVRHFLVDDDVTAQEQDLVLDDAARRKKDRYADQPLAGPRSVAVVFEKPSTRTRLSFEAGIAELGGQPIIIDARTTQL